MHPSVPIGYPCLSLLDEQNEVPESHCVEAPTCLEADGRYRSINGSCNNLANPRWGSVGEPFIPFTDKNVVSFPDDDMVFRSRVTGNVLPNARRVSVAIHSEAEGPETDPNVHQLPNMSIVAMTFAQFLDHDLTLTPGTGVCPKCDVAESLPEGSPCCDWFRYRNNASLPNDLRRRPPNCWPIPVEKDDHAFGLKDGLDAPAKDCIEFTRSQVSHCGLGDGKDPVQFNEITHYVDASNIYGSTEIQTRGLRALKKGLLRLNQFTDDTLPFHLDTCSADQNSRPPSIFHPRSFQAGDVRVNENPQLAIFHTFWVKEHNRLAYDIGRLFPDKSDEEIFQETRRYVVAEWQSIVYSEFLPLVLGPVSPDLFDFGISEQSAFDSTTMPDIFNEFATAAFRFGHSLVKKEMLLAGRNPSEGSSGEETIELVDHFFNTDILRRRQMDRLMMGMFHHPSGDMDSKMTTALTEHLFQVHGEDFGSDLAARNIQRGRDHSLASYDSVRQKCGQPALSSSFDGPKPDDFTEDVWRRFSQLYASPADIELFPGGMAEGPVGGGILGPTFTCLIGTQFANLKKGDRYFFTHSNVDESQKFCEGDLESIRKRKLRDVICDTMKLDDFEGGQRVVRNPFLLANANTNPMEDCQTSNKLVAEDLCLFEGETPNPRPNVDEGREVLLVAGGFNGSHLLTSVELWSPDGQCNLELPDLPDGPRYGLGVFTYDGKVYACGGAHSRDKGSACYILSPGATSWVASDEMKFNFPRQMSTMSKSQTSGVIFVSGGLDSEHGQTIEYLDRFTGRWMMAGSLHGGNFVRHCALVRGDADFLTIGGYGNQTGMKVNSFDDFNNLWSTEDTITYNDRPTCVFVPGSENEVLIASDKTRASIFNIETGEERLARGRVTMNRGFGALVNLNGEVYAVGGELSTQFVEHFDPRTESFSMEDENNNQFPQLKFGRSRFGYTTVPIDWFSDLGCN